MICGSRHSHPASSRNRALLIVGHIVAGAVLAAVLALIFGWFIMLLWNHILPDLVGARFITYWQSVGLILMTRILVGGLHHGAGHGHRRRTHGHAWRNYDDWWKAVGEKSFQDDAGDGSDKP